MIEKALAVVLCIAIILAIMIIVEIVKITTGKEAMR